MPGRAYPEWDDIVLNNANRVHVQPTNGWLSQSTYIACDAGYDYMAYERFAALNNYKPPSDAHDTEEGQARLCGMMEREIGGEGEGEYKRDTEAELQTR